MEVYDKVARPWKAEAEVYAPQPSSHCGNISHRQPNRELQEALEMHIHQRSLPPLRLIRRLRNEEAFIPEEAYRFSSPSGPCSAVIKKWVIVNGTVRPTLPGQSRIEPYLSEKYQCAFENGGSSVRKGAEFAAKVHRVQTRWPGKG